MLVPAMTHSGSSLPDPRGSFPTKREFFLVPQTSLLRRLSTERGGFSPVFGLLVHLLGGHVRVEVPCTQVVMLLQEGPLPGPSSWVGRSWTLPTSILCFSLGWCPGWGTAALASGPSYASWGSSRE